MPAVNWRDEATNESGRHVFTQKELQVPGLRMFGKHQTQKAIPALQSHYHENCFEFTYVSKGSIQFSVDQKRYSLAGGELFVTGPNEVHDTDSLPLAQHLMYWFQLDISDPKRLLFLEETAAIQLISQLRALPMHVVKLDEEKAHSTLTQVYKDFCTQSQHRCEMGASLLLYFIHIIIESAQRLRVMLQPNVGRVVNHVLDHLTDPLTMDQLAQIANLSVSRFKQVFKSQIGVPPREFINSERIHASLDLLKEGKTITDTAIELDFSSSNYFSVVFRRHMGCSPREYLSNLKRSPMR